ncbi:MAG: hypothetical protein ACI4DX_14900 [Oliverpabstia sp.]
MEKRYESDMTPKEKFQKEVRKIKAMSWPDRFAHIWAYYKPHMVVAAMIIGVCCLIGNIIYRSRFDTVLSIAILNCGAGDTEGMAEDFKDYMQDEDPYHEIAIDSSLYFTGDDNADYTSVMKLTTLIGASSLDVILATEGQFERYQDEEAFISMDELLTEEQKEAYGDRVSEYGIRLSDSEKLKEYGLNSGEDVYLAVFAYTKYEENAKAFISYINEGGKS